MTNAHLITCRDLIDQSNALVARGDMGLQQGMLLMAAGLFAIASAIENLGTKNTDAK